MIINLEGKQNQNGYLEIDVPAVRLYSSFKIGVKHVNFKLSSSGVNRNLENNELLTLNTNLVDRSALNPSQSIIQFPVRSGRPWQNFKPAFVLFYGLQFHNFENISFELKTFFGETRIDIESIFIQLEINKETTYGRI